MSPTGSSVSCAGSLTRRGSMWTGHGVRRCTAGAIVGNQPDTYTFKGEGADIVLPRVTAILGRLVRKPELERWNYWRTIDSIAGLVTEGGKSLDDVELRDVLSDSMTVDEWLTLNRMRP